MYRLLLLIFLAVSSGSVINNEIDKCNLSDELKAEIQSYQPVANRIINAITNGEFQNSTYDYLAEFIDKFGSRLSGTKNLEDSIDYMLKKLKDLGLDNVHGEDAPIPRWIRGNESLYLVQPRVQPLRMLGLGLSVGTPPEGIRASVIVVRSFDELKKLGKKAQNKIVVFNPPWVSYGTTVAYRSRGASEAAKVGAVAALVRSVTPFSMDTVHTGMQSYEDGVHQVPVACITPADANMLERMSRRGDQVVVELRMEARNMGQAVSRNTVAELKGRELQDKVVVVSGHLDSWDVGQGAMDDGAGAFISWNALNILNKMGLRPRRTMRAILWTGEEMGYAGAFYYVQKHLNETKNLNFVMESDIGTFKPLGLDVSGTKEAQCLIQQVLSAILWTGEEQGSFGAANYVQDHLDEIDLIDLVLESDSGTFDPVGLEFTGTDEAACILTEILGLLSAVNSTRLARPMDGGPDLALWAQRGVPSASLWEHYERDLYYWFHHSPADTMDTETPAALDRSAALWTALSYIVADLTSDLPKQLTNRQAQ